MPRNIQISQGGLNFTIPNLRMNPSCIVAMPIQAEWKQKPEHSIHIRWKKPVRIVRLLTQF